MCVKNLAGVSRIKHDNHRPADGETATITMPKMMSPQSWQMLIDTLKLWKKQTEAADVS